MGAVLTQAHVDTLVAERKKVRRTMRKLINIGGDMNDALDTITDPDEIRAARSVMGQAIEAQKAINRAMIQIEQVQNADGQAPAPTPPAP